jgi:hypothetical protein
MNPACPSCHGSAAFVRRIPPIHPAIARLGFVTAHGLGASTQLTEILRCARCSAQFGRATKEAP